MKNLICIYMGISTDKNLLNSPLKKSAIFPHFPYFGNGEGVVWSSRILLLTSSLTGRAWLFWKGRYSFYFDFLSGFLKNIYLSVGIQVIILVNEYKLKTYSQLFIIMEKFKFSLIIFFIKNKSKWLIFVLFFKESQLRKSLISELFQNTEIIVRTYTFMNKII